MPLSASFIPFLNYLLKLTDFSKYNYINDEIYIDEIYNFIFVKSSFYLGKGFWKSIDTDLIDNLGPNGISRLIGSFGKVVSRLQSGYLYHYVLSVVVGLTLFLSIYIYIL